MINEKLRNDIIVATEQWLPHNDGIYITASYRDENFSIAYVVLAQYGATFHVVTIGRGDTHTAALTECLKSIKRDAR